MPDRPGSTAINLPDRGTILAFDFGLTRIGVAVGELETAHANTLATLSQPSVDQRFAAIGALIAEWQPGLLIVGIPSHGDGTAHEMTTRCKRFANQLRGRFGLTVIEVDERLTSAAADTALRNAGQHDWRKRKQQLDAVAAQIILQDFLDNIQHDDS